MPKRCVPCQRAYIDHHITKALNNGLGSINPAAFAKAAYHMYRVRRSEVVDRVECKDCRSMGGSRAAIDSPSDDRQQDVYL
mmetsp:Transcript_12744/g.20181  ORF Transcript_12744/g.20181 Transcript_12744/m.20181 type:complete len:81 (-) Transcript_12744:166-408(-)|eukprot:1350758-Amorphochlora_amoeboformis.AAC.1